MAKDDTLNLVIGLITGVAIGLAIGILFAPDSGKETRQKLKEKASDLCNSTRERITGISYKGEQKIAPYD